MGLNLNKDEYVDLEIAVAKFIEHIAECVRSSKIDVDVGHKIITDYTSLQDKISIALQENK